MGRLFLRGLLSTTFIKREGQSEVKPETSTQSRYMSLDEVPPPGTALVEELDKRLLVQLRDGRKILGILRSFDQFANLVLEGAVELIIVGALYTEIALGLYVVRGENVVLLGEIDAAQGTSPALQEVSEAEIRQAQRAEKEQEKIKKTMKARMDFLDFD